MAIRGRLTLLVNQEYQREPGCTLTMTLRKAAGMMKVRHSFVVSEIRRKLTKSEPIIADLAAISIELNEEDVKDEDDNYDDNDTNSDASDEDQDYSPSEDFNSDDDFEDMPLRPRKAKQKLVGVCHLCGYKTADKAALADHVEDEHNGNQKRGKSDSPKKRRRQMRRVSKSPINLKQKESEAEEKDESSEKGSENLMDQCHSEILTESKTKKEEEAYNGNDKVLCHICSEECKNKKALDDHIKDNHSLHKCDKCDFKTQLIKELRNHIKTYCHICGITRRYLKAHIGAFHTVKECDKCDFSTMSQIEMTLHKKTGHRDVCGVCNFVARRSAKMEDHKCEDYIGKKRKMNQLYPCPHCPHVGTIKANLKLHIEAAHEKKKKRVECPKCQKIYTNTPALDQHLRTFHADTKENVCNICDFSSAYKGSLDKHLRSVKHRARQKEIEALKGKENEKDEEVAESQEEQELVL